MKPKVICLRLLCHCDVAPSVEQNTMCLQNTAVERICFINVAGHWFTYFFFYLTVRIAQKALFPSPRSAIATDSTEAAAAASTTSGSAAFPKMRQALVSQQTCAFEQRNKKRLRQPVVMMSRNSPIHPRSAARVLKTLHQSHQTL